jgi:aspartyl-tRNA(Asn)/glutamyl-tRNA(Gln) amidotransferase subunit B
VVFEPVIGVEVHAQLATRTKIFCGCSARFGDPSNRNVCPVCLGMPGSLPVLNARVVEYGVRAALALNCTVHPSSIFARKNYFYPDLPKGYQISQYEEPLASDGWLEVPSGAGPRRVGIVRVHLEEDAGKSLHDGFSDSDRQTYLDFNRCGVPLIEIVTRPDLQSGAEAAEFFTRLRELLVAIGVNDGNMEEGSLRCDANVSVRPAGATALGVKTEVKNLNSFRFVQKALEHEIERQIQIVRGGGRVVQETRLWDAASGRTVTMRSKEEAHDYRYFPEPDLPPLVLDPAWVESIRASLPELPEARKARLMRQHGLPEYDAEVLTRAFRGGADYFEETVAAGAGAKTASNWVLGEVRRALNAKGSDDVAVLRGDVPPARLAGLIRLVEAGAISGPTAKDVFEKMLATGRAAGEIVTAEGLGRIDDEGALRAVVRQVIADNPKPVEQYRAGKTTTLGFLVGQVMKATGGKANPAIVNALVREALDLPGV